MHYEPKEEGEYEWVSNQQSPESSNAHTSSGIYESGSLLLEGEPLLEGELHSASGDGCGGDGGYCKGHWAKKSGKGHRHGEPIGGSPFKPADFLCATVGWATPPSVAACAAYGGARYITTQK